ncbi:MAG: hypothetical protein ACREM1_10810, partial [Longimicrobiales bacterium]
ALHALLMLAGMIIQVQRGWYDVDPALYVQVLFGFELTTSLVFALFALSIHVLVNHKHVGHVVVLLLVLAPGRLLGALLGIEHPLLTPARAPDWRHSDISGFDPFTAPVLWFALYWAVWALLLALVARLFWVRGAELGIRDRVRLVRRRFRGGTVEAFAAVTALVLLVGGFVFYNTNVLNTYRTSRDVAQRRAEYERRYGRYEGAPQPEMTATELHVDIYPDRRAADVRGVHHLVNRTSQPIDTIHVAAAVASDVDTSEIAFARPARAARLDDERGHRIYVLDEPLQPGDALRMRWQVRYAARGFPARGISLAVVENGSLIEMQEWMPLIGYQSQRELSDALARREHGLAARPVYRGADIIRTVRSLDDPEASRDPTRQERVDLEVTVGTAANQIAIAPGTLRSTWTRDGRRYFHYATNAPIGIGYAIFSAKYALRTARLGDVALEVYYHPAHDLNVQRTVRSMRVSLEQYAERFGPYPYEVLRLVEYPSGGRGGLHAAHANIWYEEVFSLFDPDHDEREIDVPFAVVAHEVGHQFQPRLAWHVEGAALLSESFAWYAALGVIEAEYGANHLARFLAYMRRDYLTPRSRADVPLLRASDWFVAYRKGPFAMYALREYMGQDRVDLAWRRVIARHRSNEPPWATSLDLYRELQQVTPASLQSLLADLLARNTFWELETRRATAQPTASGAWRVTLEVDARRSWWTRRAPRRTGRCMTWWRSASTRRRTPARHRARRSTWRCIASRPGRRRSRSRCRSGPPARASTRVTYSSTWSRTTTWWT